jgi:hypothetical protein
MVMSTFNPTVLVGSSMVLKEVRYLKCPSSKTQLIKPDHNSLQTLGFEKQIPSSAFVIHDLCFMLSQSISLLVYERLTLCECQWG